MRTHSVSLEEYRIRAARLLKALRSDAPADAIVRFQASPEWQHRAADEIRAEARLKNALHVVAREAGFRDWPGLKNSFETVFDTESLFPPERSAAFLNLWYKSYEEAEGMIGGAPPRFLFPFRQHFVVCEAGRLEALGIDIADPDWQRIGYDWVKPRDTAARARLAAKLHELLG